MDLKELVCSEIDLECLSMLCPVSMKFNGEEDRCEEEVVDAVPLGVVGNVKRRCREGFVWVQWKYQCLRQV